MVKSVVLLSGGLDSTTLLYDEATRGSVMALSFDYGQRHVGELEAARALADNLGVEHYTVSLGAYDDPFGEITPFGYLLPGSALTDRTSPVPDGHYAAESMKSTVVPNRNAIMISLAYGVAVAHQAERVAVAVHAGDHAIYPDCRLDFIQLLNLALDSGNRWQDTDQLPGIVAPFIGLEKVEIAARAYNLEVPIGRTWSCYKGGTVHCGRCGTCVERREAIEMARVNLGIQEPDPTEYLDRDYWRDVVGTETAAP